MHRRVFALSVGLAAVVNAASAAAGQHEGHQAGTAAAPTAAQVADCRQAQPVITALLNAALKRLDDARLTNSAPAMRAAADDVQAALVDVRTQLAPCATMAPAAAEGQAAHTMPAAPAAPGSPRPATQPAAAPPPVAADAHAGHTMPAPPAPRAPSPPAARRSAGAPSTAPAGDAHAGHVMPPAAPAQAAAPPAPGRATAAAPPTNIADLKCSNAVDPRTAPRMLYQGRMYYFCTDASRAEFAKDPAKYVTAPAAAAPAHAH
jgi:YHS domain-containing protein